MGRFHNSNRYARIVYSDIMTPESVAYYQSDPIAFIEDHIFDVNANAIDEDEKPYLSSQQIEIVTSVAKNKRTLAVTGKGVGKTAIAALLVIWFICVFPFPRIRVTAPTAAQLSSALWTEVEKWLEKSSVRSIFTHTSERLYLNECPKTWWAEPRTANTVESMAGLHEENMLIIGDEASGIADDIIDALVSTMSKPNNKILLLGNWTRTTGRFHEAITSNTKRWEVFRMSGEDSPWVDREFIKDLEERFGRDHDIFRVSILAMPPKGNPDSMIPLSEVESAMRRDCVPKIEDPIEIGVDVARMGDDSTVIFWRQGMKVYSPIVKGKTRANEVVDMILDLVVYIRSKTGTKQTIKVKLDDNGLGGGVTDYLLLDREHNIEVVPCLFLTTGGDDYNADDTTLMWSHVRDRIDLISLPDDRFLKEELSARRFKVEGGKIRLESKGSYKNYFKKSPDRADALVLCFYPKKKDRTVLPQFDAMDNAIIKKEMNYMGGMRKYASIFYSADHFVSIVFGGWDGYKFHLFAEYTGDDDIQHIANSIRMTIPENITVIGNDRMFGIRGEDLTAQYRKKGGLVVKENMKYDENGAIRLFSQMLTQKNICISEKNRRLISQLNSWNMNEKKLKLETEYGLCYATINLISQLKNLIEPKPVLPPPPISYSGGHNKKSGTLVNPMIMW